MAVEQATKRAEAMLDLTVGVGELMANAQEMMDEFKSSREEHRDELAATLETWRNERVQWLDDFKANAADEKATRVSSVLDILSADFR